MNLKPSRVALSIILSVISPSILSNTTDEQTPATTQNSATARDTMITQQIKAKLSVNPSIPKNIQVSTQNGVVTLMGEVDASAQKNTIEGTARSTPGVTSINSQIQVKPRPVVSESPATMPAPSD